MRKPSSWAGLLARFATVGALATVTYLIVANMLLKFSSIQPEWASVIAYLVGMVVSYLGQSKVTFETKAARSRQMIKFAILSLMGLAMSYLVVRYFSGAYPEYSSVATVLVAIAVPFLSFFVMTFWVFIEPREKS